VIRNYRCKHHQQNTQDKKENFRQRRYWHTVKQKKYKKFLTQIIQEIQNRIGDFWRRNKERS
jgi:hypothetical protein